MASKLSENAKKIMSYLQEIENGDVTVHQVASELDLQVNQVTGTFNSFVKKGLGERIEAEVENADGTHDKVKFLKLTSKGLDFDVDSEED